MDTLLERRNLAKEDNNAQKGIDDKIRRLAGSSREQEFTLPDMPLRGEVDFSKLKPLNVTSISNKDGNSITEVFGIPDNVSNFKLVKNLLVEMPQLPKSLKTLNLDGNHIEKANLSELTRLKVANLSNNRLTSLTKKDLPDSLEELYIDNNDIKLLNLIDLQSLRILHCRNNKMLRIDNIPPSLVDLQVEGGNPSIRLDYAFMPNNTGDEEHAGYITEEEFVKSMHDYFALKAKYERREIADRHELMYDAIMVKKMGKHQAKKIVKRFRPKCVNCKRPVGTVFNMRENRLMAYCGDTRDPCALKINIFKGEFENDDEYAKYNTKTLMEIKEQIIRQKMDVLFNYASEEKTVAKFKDLIEDYNLYSSINKLDLDMREEKRFNVHKREIIKAKMAKISEIKATMNTHMDEYAENGNRDELNTAMNIYIREYIPEIESARLMKYEITEMITKDDEQSRVRVLNQCPASLRRLETMLGEGPKVLKYVTGKTAVPVQNNDNSGAKGLNDSHEKLTDEGIE